VRRDLACAALGLVLAAAYWLAADALPRSALADGVGADGVPKLYAVLLAAVCVLLGLRRATPTDPARTPLRALGVAGLGFAYIALAPLAGYLVAVALLTGAAALYYGAAPRPRVALFALASAAALWLAFAVGLGVSLPG